MYQLSANMFSEVNRHKVSRFLLALILHMSETIVIVYQILLNLSRNLANSSDI